jgi:1-aminocyclopropane-1-carboxylate deaminase/D-cysteine desulfhydrase-like pyridoxal-dependent ACC family enzyme
VYVAKAMFGLITSIERAELGSVEAVVFVVTGPPG